MLNLLYSVSDEQWFNEQGVLLGSDEPYIPYGNREKVIIQLYQSVSGESTEDPNIENWVKYTDFQGGGYGARLACDNNYLSRIKAETTADITAGTTISTIDLKINTDPSLVAEAGTLEFFDGDNIVESISYTGREDIGDNVVRFTLNGSATIKNEYQTGTHVDVPEMLFFQSSMIAEESDPATGLFSFDVVCDSVKLRNKMRYESKAKLSSPSDIAALELAVFHTDDNGNINVVKRFYNTNFTITGGIADISIPTDLTVEQVNAVLENLTALNTNGFQIQLSKDLTTWEDYDSIADIYNGYTAFRFRLKSAGGEYSAAVPVISGTTPHIGENGNWFIGDVDTGVNAVGQKGDKGDQGVQGPAGVNGLTPYIGENKNWWIGTEDTGILAEGSNLFTNGVPPYEFTNSDLSSGILSRTFAELGIDSAVPVSVNIISGDGVVMDGDVRLALIWTDTGLKVDLSQLGTISGTWKLVFAGGTKVTGGGTGSGNGYTRTVVSSNTTAQTGYWYTCTSAITLTLPAGSIGAYVRISTDYNTTGVIVATTNGETIDGDAEGFTLDKTSGTVEVFWNGSGWTVIEAK